MKKIVIFIAITLLISSISVFGAEEVSVFVNGSKIISDAPAVVVNDSTMLPFRAIFNALGINDDSIVWTEKTKSIQVQTDGKFIFLVIGSPGAVINNDMIILNTAPYIENDRTYVPVRFVSESLGAKVDWDEVSKTVKITK